MPGVGHTADAETVQFGLESKRAGYKAVFSLLKTMLIH